MLCLEKVTWPSPTPHRLVWECAARGFASQGNEFSAYMLVASNFILNKVSADVRSEPGLPIGGRHRQDQLRIVLFASANVER